MTSPLTRLRNPVFRRFARDDRGVYAIIFALAMIPIFFLIGLVIDYSTALRNASKLQAAADAAALAAVTPAMLAQTSTQSKNTAISVFNAQASNIPTLNWNPSNLNVSVTDNGLTRTVNIAYAASSQNAFPNILQQSVWPLSGSSQSLAQVPPNIDFYLLLDNSPSMAIAATTAGINTMVANTSTQGGCAFACHEANPSADGLGNPGGVDNYTLAQQLGVVTRIANLRTSTQTLMDTATTTEATYNSTYRMAISTFNTGGTSSITPLTSSLSSAKTAAGNIDVMLVYQNNWLTSTNHNNDEDTDFETAMSNMNTAIPTPGSGVGGDTPQEVLFLVTDGVNDKNSGGTRTYTIDPTICTTIKNRGIRIAVLYTTYYPLPTNNWYNTYIAPIQNNIGPTLQGCASPSLYFPVSTDQDISAAMTNLFLTAVRTAHLTQ